MGNLETAKDLGQGVYTQSEINNKPSGFKNYIINGGFDVWQRGTSVATNSNAAGEYTADRWFTNQSGYGGTQTVSKDYTEVDGGIISTLKSTQTTVCVNRCMSILEDISCLNLRGKTVTLSFWAKRVGNDGTFFIGSGNDSVYNSSNFLIDSTPSTGSNAVINSSVWKKYSISHYIPNNSQIAIGFVQQNGSVGDYVQIANVQLEEGSVATPFEQRPYGLEFDLCQRYYQTDNINAGGANSYKYMGGSRTVSFNSVNLFPVVMRDVPTIVIATPTYVNCSGITASGVQNTGFFTSVTASAGNYRAYSAIYTADAEL